METVQIEFNEEEIRTMLLALHYMAGMYQGELEQLMREGRNENNKGLLERVKKYSNLASGIEFSSRDIVN